MSELNVEEQKEILGFIRQTIKEYLEDDEIKPITLKNPKYDEISGAFVTLHKKGALRGCIGHIIGIKPLKNTIQEMAIASSTQDPRFPPVEASELDDLDIEVSILSPLKRVKNPEEIVVGKHGIVMSQGPFKGILLPQVATEYGWDREIFLNHTCLKAGLPEDAWKKGATIEIFSAQVFGEKDPT